MIIDDLPSISIANDSDEIAIEQGTATKKITKGNFLQEIVSSISSLISDISGKVSKSGDTMSGNLIINSGLNYTGVELRGASGAPRCKLGNTGTRLTIDSYADGSSGGERYLLPIPDTRSSDAWYAIITNKLPAESRRLLGLLYAANDTFSITSSLVLNGFAFSTTTVYFDLVTEKSTENISTITVTAMTGFIAGTNGRSPSTGNVNYTGAGYTISCTKQGTHHVRIGVTKSSDFDNLTSSTPVTYFGTLTLKFT